MRRAAARRAVACITAALALWALAACGDKPQEGAKSAKKADAKAWDGSTESAFTAEGWKQGDRAGWEQQIKARNQNQNEYTRTP